MKLNNNIITLWQQHIFWIRAATLSLINNTPDYSFIIERLYKNPIHFEEMLLPIYGKEKSEQFRDLLKEHIILIIHIIEKNKSKNLEAASEVEKAWYTSADKIAHFLSSINPYWNKDEWKNLLHKHLELTKAQTIDIINKYYEISINIFNEIEKVALNISNYMFYGIIYQFPNKYHIQ
ncbi:hypothetical protein [Clostridium polynesiense]|uniref:hypothetical protein n=1 Tax=Clostridium polynesiense TaxID=1325933 RepID=UPI00058B7AD3|nr:hypothetical protein [Clostridium polynesiense]